MDAEKHQDAIADIAAQNAMAHVLGAHSGSSCRGCDSPDAWQKHQAEASTPRGMAHDLGAQKETS
jgi:hypothetical protein